MTDTTLHLPRRIGSGFITTSDMCRAIYRRAWMRERRMDEVYRERERAQQRAYRRELRVAKAFAGLRFEDQPGAD